jgi:hypothetical protein
VITLTKRDCEAMKFNYYKEPEGENKHALFDIQFKKGVSRDRKNLQFTGFFNKYITLEVSLFRNKWVFDLEYGYGYDSSLIRKKRV